MKAAIVEHPGQTPIWAEFASPAAQAGEVVVAVSAAALSPLVRGRASGSHYSAGGSFPFVVGVDGVGRTEDGRRVYFMLPRAPFGAMAERTVVAEGQCVALPDTIDDAGAAALANPGMSSWAALVERARIVRGETVLINGATGAAGQLAVKIARHLGAAKVIATGRNAEVLATLGADVTIALGQSDEALESAFAAQFAARVDIVLDYLWGPSGRSLLIAGAKAGPDGVPIRFVQIGSAGGAEIAMPAAALRSSSIVMMGSGLGSVGLDRLIASIAGVMDAAGPAGLTTALRTVPLAEVTAAWGVKDDQRRTVFVTGA
jgi:NADPH:quinone reductase-like Zn-dependent oxidoreductase